MAAKGTERPTDVDCRNAAPRETRYKLADGGTIPPPDALRLSKTADEYWPLMTNVIATFIALVIMRDH